MAAPRRFHKLAGVDGDPETGVVTYWYDVVRADDESDHPEVLRSYSRTVPFTPAEPDESGEYRGPGCDAGCGC